MRRHFTSTTVTRATLVLGTFVMMFAGCDAILGIQDHSLASVDGGSGSDGAIESQGDANGSGIVDASGDVNEVGPTSDAAEASPCAMCDGSCYDGICNGNAIEQLSMGGSHGCALIADGTVWCWGDNTYGEMGSTPGGMSASAVQIPGLKNVQQVSAGTSHTCVVKSDSSVWCWGINLQGELGHAPGTAGDVVCGSSECNDAPSQVPGLVAKQVSLGRWSACAVTTTSSVACWGWNGEGQLGRGGAPTFTVNATPAPAPGLADVTHVEVSLYPGDNACAIDSDTNLWCWGWNKYGALGHTPGTLGDVSTCGESGPGSDMCNTTPQRVTLEEDGGGGNFSNVASVAPSYSMCAAQLGGSVWCCGTANGAELGLGAPAITMNSTPQLTELSPIPPISAISGGQTMCALAASGAVLCWGIGSTELPGSYGVDAGCSNYAAASAGCVVAPAQLSGITATTLSNSGINAALALTTSGVLVAWGNNTWGELGHQPGTLGDDTNDNNPTPTPVQGLP